MHAELKIKSGKGPAEVGRLGPAVVGQAHVDGRVTVHPLLVVQHGTPRAAPARRDASDDELLFAQLAPRESLGRERRGG